MAEKARKFDPTLELRNRANGLSRGLRTKWANLEKKRPDFTRDVFERFDEIDLDGDGFISETEIDGACHRRTFTDNYAAALVALKKAVDELAALSDDETGWEGSGVARSDLAGFEFRARESPDDKLVRAVTSYYDRAKLRIFNSPQTVFVDDKHPSIDATKCKQGLMGDCFFLAPMIAMALRDPGRLLAMIEPVDPLTWRIGFPGADGPISIETPTDAEVALFASADALWPIMFEMAYGEASLRSAYGLLSRSRVDTVDDGGFVQASIGMLTGNSTDTDVLSVTEVSETRSKLVKALGNSKLVVASTRARAPWEPAKKAKMPTGLAFSHAYSVIAFDSVDDIVTVRNPWGDDGGGPNAVEIERGVFDIPLHDFDSFFSLIVYEE